jgi:hypothetical protein
MRWPVGRAQSLMERGAQGGKWSVQEVEGGFECARKTVGTGPADVQVFTTREEHSTANQAFLSGTERRTRRSVAVLRNTEPGRRGCEAHTRLPLRFMRSGGDYERDSARAV